MDLYSLNERRFNTAKKMRSSRKCSFTIDDRERDLLDQFRRTITDMPNETVGSVECMRLPLGDVRIEAMDRVRAAPVVIVERKRVDDLMASVFDGRLVEQGRRLRQVAERDGVYTVLLVEGIADEGCFRRSDHPEARYRHFLKTYVGLVSDRQGPLVLRSRGLRETVLLLLTLHRTLMADAAGTGACVSQSMPVRRRLDPFVHQLCGTVGVSERRAVAVQREFANMAELLSRWRSNPVETESRLLHALEGQSLMRRLLQDLGATSVVHSGNRPEHRNQPVRHKKRQQEFDDRRLKRACPHVHEERRYAYGHDDDREEIAVHPTVPILDLRLSGGDLVDDGEQVIDMQQDEDAPQDDGHDPDRVPILSLLADF